MMMDCVARMGKSTSVSAFEVPESPRGTKLVTWDRKWLPGNLVWADGGCHKTIALNYAWPRLSGVRLWSMDLAWPFQHSASGAVKRWPTPRIRCFSPAASLAVKAELTAICQARAVVECRAGNSSFFPGPPRTGLSNPIALGGFSGQREAFVSDCADQLLLTAVAGPEWRLSSGLGWSISCFAKCRPPEASTETERWYVSCWCEYFLWL